VSSSVVLPQPLGPSSTTYSPCASESDRGPRRKSPRRIEDLLVVNHWIKINQQGYKPWEKEIKLEEGQTKQLRVELEKLPPPQGRGPALPDLAMGFYDCVCAFDNKKRKAWVMANAAGGRDGEALIEDRIRRIGDFLAGHPIDAGKNCGRDRS